MVCLKKVLIITLYANNNFGNKLQNYALQEYIKKLDEKIEVKTQRVINERYTNNIIEYFIWKIYSFFKNINKKVDNREACFIEFNNNFMNYTNKYIGTNTKKSINNADYYVYGSDQIWNPNGAGRSNYFIGLLTNNNISYAASLSAEEIPDKLKNKYRRSLLKFKNISVREEKGKEILKSIINRDDIETLIDPTMLLTKEEWLLIEKKPKKLNSKKYILNYFLGNLSQKRKDEINKIAYKYSCDVINILDKNDPLYESGPSEFLYLERHAFFICTDSFHSSVFALLYDRPFIVFDREQNNIGNMGSRIDTLINKFKLENRRYNGKITNDNLEHNYKEAYRILEEERKKSIIFLRKALDLDK